MKTRFFLPLLLALSAAGAQAEVAKSYQVTGPITALTDSVITVQKGDEKWEIARGATTKSDGKLAVGDKVTVYYRMTATEIESKTTPATDKAEKKKEPKKK